MNRPETMADRALGCLWAFVVLGLLCLSLVVAFEAFTTPPSGFAP